MPQDKVHHAEGDVLVHTRRVTEALVAKAAWRGLPAVEREILFAAALLHDVGKPATTVIGEGGRVSSPNHAREGESIARDLLWRREAPAACREAIAALVRLHGLPLWFIDQATASRSLIRASWRIRLDRVALLSRPMPKAASAATPATSRKGWRSSASWPPSSAASTGPGRSPTTSPGSPSSAATSRIRTRCWTTTPPAR